MKVEKKSKRDAILYVRVTKENKEFIEREASKLNYGTISEYVDALINSIRKKK